ncbi:MAG: proline--tRNA ligase [Spirochaetia bacterium]
MRMSRAFGRTLRQDSAGVEITSHKLLIRAGYIRQLASGIFSYLPLAVRSIRKIENIIRDEMNALGGQEISMPVVNPADVWKETGRWYSIDAEMARFSDRNDRDMVLAMTHEEVVADLVRSEITSYRQLPGMVYHIQTKFRDDPRPRGGLIRVREFVMKDSYTLDADWEGLDKQYEAHYHAYFNIFRRCGLPVIAVKSDIGMMGGKEAHEFMYLNEVGEDTLIICDKCGYTANRQVAAFRKDKHAGTEAPVERIHTPEKKTIEELADFLKVTPDETAKALFMVYGTTDDQGNEEEKFAAALIRGDLTLNETKLANLLGASKMRPALPEEIKKHGAIPGFGSPVNMSDAVVVIDDSISDSSGFITGANEDDYHLKNVKPGRDFTVDYTGDIAAADEGMECIECGSSLKAKRGIEVGNIFKLGTKYSDAFNCKFLDSSGQEKPVVMGSYGIGIGRLLACVAQEFNDDKGLIWPVTVAPYQVYLVNLSKDPGKAEDLYSRMITEGIEVLFDDRDERAGVKFNDADLLGIPIRITLGDRSLKEGKAEVTVRKNGVTEKIALETLIEEISRRISEMTAEIAG